MQDQFSYAANLALYLTERTGSCLGRWRGRMSAKEQRALFGVYFGKGTLVIDGTTETVQHVVKVCFGLDWDVTREVSFAGLTTADLLAALGPCGK